MMRLLKNPRVWILLSLAPVVAATLLWLLGTTRAIRAEARARFFEQYNRQQLLMAEQAARTLEELFQTVRRDLGLVASLFEQGEVTWAEAEARKRTLSRVYDGLSEIPVFDIALLDRNGTVAWSYPPSPGTVGVKLAWRDYFKWARDEGQPGQIYLTRFRPLVTGAAKGANAMIAIEGIYGKGREFKGLALFAVHFHAFAQKHVLSLRVGPTGSAWLVDCQSRTVLVHPNGTVGSQRLEEAALPRWPGLYELLVKTLEGRSGTGSYKFQDPEDLSRDVTELVGYAPARIGNQMLALGVATPERDVEKLLSSFLKRQEKLTAVVGVTLFTGAVLACALLLTWNRSLSKQVTVRTRDLEQARAELVSAEKLAAVGHLALGLTHEIRNPLSAIRMNVQMIRDELPGSDAGLRENFEIVESEIQRLNRLLSDIMGFARPRPLRLTHADLREEVQRVVRLMARLLEEESVELEVRSEGELKLLCDPEQLQQVLLNLVVNGVEAMQESAAPRKLTLEASRSGDNALLRITDTGVGVRREDRERVFDPFFTTKAEGGGLGLPTVQSIVLRHGGGVDLESGPSGTTFTVRLPIGGPPASDGADGAAGEGAA
ncbi:MAG: two-component sensor histidine kinase [Deltaproteobacteria bacterium]|nr:two-component sensor histidine kinase [Deltaproteobacteria bacterium]